MTQLRSEHDIELDVEDVQAQRETIYMCADIDNVQIQLCQPGLRKTPKRIFLDTHGEGVFHLGFSVASRLCNRHEEAL